MIIRLSKVLLAASVGVFALLVGIDNLLDYGANLVFVEHVLSMDTTFPGSALRWRAITSPSLQNAAYWLIIGAELFTGVLCLAGAWRMFAARETSAARFNAAKDLAVAGLRLRLPALFPRLPRRRRRVVQDVAVADVERAGGRIPLRRVLRAGSDLRRAAG